MMEAREAIFEAYKKQLIEQEKRYLEAHYSEIDSFIKFCKGRGLNISKKNFKYLQTIGVIAEHDNILSIVQPKLVRDKEGLVNWSDIEEAYNEMRGPNAGYLYAKDHIAMASPLFRRGHHRVNNWAPRFIELFWALDKSHLEEVCIALDFDRVRINIDNSRYGEMDTWYGAPYNDDISLIEDSVVKLRPPSDLAEGYIQSFFSSAYALDIEWYTSADIKTFQSLEFKTDDVVIVKKNEKYHPVRYVHAEYDLKKKQFRHFDGALQYLTPDEYYARRDTDFNHNRKVSRQIKPLSEKLFKFNGNIDIEMWKEFTSHFYTANPLIYEYYSGKYPDYVEEMLQKLNDKN